MKVFQNSRRFTFSCHPKAEGSPLFKIEEKGDSSRGCRMTNKIIPLSKTFLEQPLYT